MHILSLIIGDSRKYLLFSKFFCLYICLIFIYIVKPLIALLFQLEQLVIIYIVPYQIL